eukprot:TRINITY_DN30325_c0_g1_i1.p1 TRINITY_DN30325_c0_g1~~TRINITY_DN30325_c0_g1_i1.p1  ORF type:complete len:257 (+),score=41.47 TRINITY_DN30325_c0_g1_i1:29-772(+)
MSRNQAYSGKVFAITGVVVPIIAIVLTIIINRALGHDIGGIPWPYFSEAGAIPPEYFVFSIGLTISTFLMFAMFYYQGRVQSQRLDDQMIGAPNQGTAKTLSNVGVFFGVLSAPFTALLSIFDTRNHTDIHLYFAIAFFIFHFFYTILNTVAIELLYRHTEESQRSMNLIRSRNFKIGLLAYITVGILLLYGVLYAMVCENSWTDYSKCPEIHTARAVSQTATVVGLLMYNATLWWDFDEMESKSIV